MDTLKKTIWFDQNSEPQKSYIWYRGEGKFYEYSGGNWVLAYDLANTPTQSELESIADKLSDGSEETVDANIGSILNALSDKINASATILEGIVESIPTGYVHLEGNLDDGIVVSSEDEMKVKAAATISVSGGGLSIVQTFPRLNCLTSAEYEALDNYFADAFPDFTEKSWVFWGNVVWDEVTIDGGDVVTLIRFGDVWKLVLIAV